MALQGKGRGIGPNRIKEMASGRRNTPEVTGREQERLDGGVFRMDEGNGMRILNGPRILGRPWGSRLNGPPCSPLDLTECF
jgi:hypothetical protein